MTEREAVEAVAALVASTGQWVRSCDVAEYAQVGLSQAIGALRRAHAHGHLRRIYGRPIGGRRPAGYCVTDSGARWLRYKQETEDAGDVED